MGMDVPLRDDLLVQAWLSVNRPTPCPTRFSVASPQAACAQARVDPELLERSILKMHSDGFTKVQISELGGFFLVDVEAILSKNGLKPNRFSIKNRSAGKPALRKQVQLAWAEGTWPSKTALAVHLGISLATVNKALKGVAWPEGLRAGSHATKLRSYAQDRERNRAIIMLSDGGEASVVIARKLGVSAKLVRKIVARSLEPEERALILGAVQ